MSAEVAAAVRAAALPTIVINNTHVLAPWADMLYACDAKLWLHPQYKDGLLNFAGLKVTCDDSLPFEQVLCVRYSGTSGFDPDPSFIRTGNNSGYQALHIAIHAGASRVLLCGFDMHGKHWFGSHPDGLMDADPNVHATMFIPEFEKLAPLLPALGVDVINCTPGSALRCFPSGELNAELRRSIPARVNGSGGSHQRATCLRQ